MDCLSQWLQGKRHGVFAGGSGEDGKLTKIWKRSGTGRIDLDIAGAGDIVSVTGLASARIADTVGAHSLSAALEPGEIEPPTLRSVHICLPCRHAGLQCLAQTCNTVWMASAETFLLPLYARLMVSLRIKEHQGRLPLNLAALRWLQTE